VYVPVQITAEQILREARELQEQDFKAPKQKITDETELAEYRLRKRKEFEDLVRRVRWNSSVWVKVRADPCHVSHLRMLELQEGCCVQVHMARKFHMDGLFCRTDNMPSSTGNAALSHMASSSDAQLIGPLRYDHQKDRQQCLSCERDVQQIFLHE